MAAIKEILEFEADRTDREMQRAIHLFQEGSFYRAYEWSAWLMCRCLHEFKVTHRRMKGIEQSVTLIGFPVTAKLAGIVILQGCTELPRNNPQNFNKIGCALAETKRVWFCSRLARFLMLRIKFGLSFQDGFFRSSFDRRITNSSRS